MNKETLRSVPHVSEDPAGGGNYIGDVLAGLAIRIKGESITYRSYQIRSAFAGLAMDNFGPRRVREAVCASVERTRTSWARSR